MRTTWFSWWICFSTIGIAGWLVGCAPAGPPLAAVPHIRPIASRFFSKVKIIGSAGTGPGHFNKPQAVAVDRHDNLFVADMTGRVQKFDANGSYLFAWQVPKSGFDPDLDLATDGAGNVVVIDPYRHRLYDYTPGGKLLARWDRIGLNDGQAGTPHGAVADGHGHLFVSEYGKSERIQKFELRPLMGTSSGSRAVRFVGNIGKPGIGPGELNRAEGLALDTRGRLYVADSCNHRIQVFSPEGKFLRAFGRAGSNLGELSYPYDICIDRQGMIFVCEFGNNRLQVFDPQGKPLEVIGGPGTGPGRFNNPWRIALDSQGDLYVADSRNNRVQEFIR